MNNDNIQIIDSSILAENFKQVGKAIGDSLNSIANVFINVWESVKKTILPYFNRLDKNISKKRFIKLLMSHGIQRNDANKIVKKYHEEKGEYKYKDVFIEWRKFNDR